MSILHLGQIENRIRQIYEDKVDVSDLGQNIESHSFLSRSLAAFAILLLSGCSDDESASSVTDGSDDNGIDAIHFDTAENRLYIVQSKWLQSGGAGEPDNAEIKLFADGVRDLFNLRFERFNNRVRGKKAIVSQVLNDPRATYVLVLVHTGTSELAKHGTQTLKDLLEEMNDTSQIVSLEVVNQQRLHRSLAQAAVGEPVCFKITLRHWGKVESPTAFYGQVNGMEIARIYETFGPRVLRNNIRGMLGSTEVNGEILNTVVSEPHSFWFFNNGITIIADRIERAALYGGDRDLGIFECTDAKIVNGAQTVSTLGRAIISLPENLEKVWVPLRLVSLSDCPADFGARLTRANNMQNRVEARDFVSQDPEQNRIKMELAVEGISYLIIRSDESSASPEDFDVVEATTAMACANEDLGLAVQAKREIGRLWEDLTRAPYKALFNASVNGIVVDRCVRVQREIDRVLAAICSSGVGARDGGVAVHGNRFVAHMVFKELPRKTVTVSPTEWKSHFENLDINGLVRSVHKRLCARIEEQFPSSILPTLFKNLSKCRQLENRWTERAIQADLF